MIHAILSQLKCLCGLTGLTVHVSILKKKSNIKQVCLQDRLNLGMVKLN